MPTYYLQKDLVQAGNTHGFAGTGIQFSFDTALTKIDENLDKKIAAKVLRPRSRNAYNNYPSMIILIDLKQLDWNFTVTGVLTNDSGNMTAAKYNVDVTQNGSALTDIAVNKKNLLIAFMEQGGNCKWYHRNFGKTRPAFPGGFEAATTYEPVQIISLKFEDDEAEVQKWNDAFTSGTTEQEMREGEQRIKFTMVLQRGQDRAKV